MPSTLSHRAAPRRRPRSGRAAATALAALLVAPAAGLAQSESPTTPFIPATTPGKSPFKANPLSSEPLGLTPDSGTRAHAYPDEPVLLAWDHVPGAVSYTVEVADTPGFGNIVWSDETDQNRIAPPELLADGGYWWRVIATDAAGTVGLTSSVARVVKSWPSTITGQTLSAVPSGPGVSTVLLNPYMRWDALPGAATYDLEVSAGNNFGFVTFFGKDLGTASGSPAEAEGGFVIPDDSYAWRVRAKDPANNPGPWASGSPFTRAWVAPTLTSPAQGATTHDNSVTWDPVAGADKYQVQISDQLYVWQGDHLLVDTTTASTSLTPTFEESDAGPIAFGNLWWRVRPLGKNAPGTWSETRNINWQPAAITTPTPTLSDSGDSTTALMPRLSWTPVTGATLYRVDIAADSQFNTVLESQHTTSTSWTSRTPLPDNIVGSGYHWRVIWGTGPNPDDPQWQVDESVAPSGTFTKETDVTLATQDLGTVSSAPMVSWSLVPGVARYEVQVSSSERFDGDTRKATVWGTGHVAGAGTGQTRIGDGSWFYRVRGIDGGGAAQTWSETGRFTLTLPRPEQDQPSNGATVVGAPTLRWGAVPGACGYEVQISRRRSFTTASGDPEDVLATSQTAYVPTGEVVDGNGRFHWRVRANLCDDVTGQWSPTRNFRSVRPPDFSLASLPARVDYNRRVTVAGRLRYRGRAVKRARLVLERRVWPQDGYRPVGLVRTNSSGRYRFSLKMRRNASYRLVWRETAKHPRGVAPFAIRVVPRLNLSLTPSLVVRKGRIGVRGTVFPRRRVLLQQRTSDGWETIRSFRPRRARFRTSVKADFEPGRHQLRLLVRQDSKRRLATRASRRRSVLVYDRFVVR